MNAVDFESGSDANAISTPVQSRQAARLEVAVSVSQNPFHVAFVLEPKLARPLRYRESIHLSNACGRGVHAGRKGKALPDR